MPFAHVKSGDAIGQADHACAWQFSFPIHQSSQALLTSSTNLMICFWQMIATKIIQNQHPGLLLDANRGAVLFSLNGVFQGGCKLPLRPVRFGFSRPGNLNASQSATPKAMYISKKGLKTMIIFYSKRGPISWLHVAARWEEIHLNAVHLLPSWHQKMATWVSPAEIHLYSKDIHCLIFWCLLLPYWWLHIEVFEHLAGCVWWLRWVEKASSGRLPSATGGCDLTVSFFGAFWSTKSHSILSHHDILYMQSWIVEASPLCIQLIFLMLLGHAGPFWRKVFP